MPQSQHKMHYCAGGARQEAHTGGGQQWALITHYAGLTAVIKTRGKFGKRLIRSNYKYTELEWNSIILKITKAIVHNIYRHLDCLFLEFLTSWMSLVINLRMRLQGIHQ